MLFGMAARSLAVQEEALDLNLRQREQENRKSSTERAKKNW